MITCKFSPDQTIIHQISAEVHQNSPEVHQASPEVHQTSLEVHQTSSEVQQASPEVHQTSQEVHQSSPEVQQTSLASPPLPPGHTCVLCLSGGGGVLGHLVTPGGDTCTHGCKLQLFSDDVTVHQMPCFKFS